MNLKFKKLLKYLLLVLLSLLVLVFAYFFIGKGKPAKNIIWGVNFSQKQAESLGLDWKETYLAILNDLGAKRIKIAAHWDLLELKPGEYNFNDLDWQVEQAEEKGAKLLLAIGMKTPRWPECHIPQWAKNLGKEEQQERILKLLENLILKYRDRVSVWAWQVENEPFFSFGECPWSDKSFLKKEVALVRSLDFKGRPVVISDTGELSLWFGAARIGDMVGTTMYRKVWSKEVGFYVSYPFPPIFYQRKAQLINKIFGKEVICVELQAEPWGKTLLSGSPIKEQEKTMDLEQFKKNIAFAKKTGLKEFYLWGTEWWYWMKEKYNQPEIWNEARKLFKQ